MTGRDVTTAFASAISSDTIYPIILVSAEFASATVNVWNGVGNIIWNSTSWTGFGDLLNISDITESTEIRAQNISITISGIPTSYKSLALQSVELDNDVTIYFGLRDSSGSVIADPETIFKGKMDEVSFTESSQGSEFNLAINNRLVELQKIRNRRYTNQDQLQLYPSDTGFRHVVNTTKVITWGTG